MSIINPYRLTIHDIISYLDSQAIREETKLLIIPKSDKSYQREIQETKTRTAQLLLRMAKQAAASNEPQTLLSLLSELPE